MASISWADLKFPPVNLWNYPKKYADVSEYELKQWYSIMNYYESLSKEKR